MSATGFEDAKIRGMKAADDLIGVARGKHAAARLDPGADRSRANAEKAKREGWSRTPEPSHRPSQ